MRTLRGKVTCSTTSAIEEGAVAKISVVDCCLMDVRSKKLGSVEVSNIKSFPFEYEVKFDDSKVDLGIEYGFTVNCRIEKNEKLLFINDTAHPIIQDGEIKDSVDVAVIVISYD